MTTRVIPERGRRHDCGSAVLPLCRPKSLQIHRQSVVLEHTSDEHLRLTTLARPQWNSGAVVMRQQEQKIYDKVGHRSLDHLLPHTVPADITPPAAQLKPVESLPVDL